MKRQPKLKPTGQATTIPRHRIPLERTDGELPGREVVGSKALNLMAMARLGLPVPPAFVLGTGLCRQYLERGTEALEGLEAALKAELAILEQRTGRRLGDPKRPLLVSVRSGAPVSMPGMMETVLNVGATSKTLPGIVRLTGNPRLALDCERRLLSQYGEVVHAIPAAAFEAIIASELASSGLADRQDLDIAALRRIVVASRAAFEEKAGTPLPDDPVAQLAATVEAVLKSWMSERAACYRRLNDIPETLGTAVIVQTMVFGNAGPTSGSGVGFSRNPADGSKLPYVDYLPDAQGEDVVSGRRNALGSADIERLLPAAWRDLTRYAAMLEQAFADMQDFEFTVEDGCLHMLQARTGKRTPQAALKIACDMVDEALITPATALTRLEGIDLEAIVYRDLDTGKDALPLARAIAASTGVAVGRAVMDPSRVASLKAEGHEVVLVRDSAETSDIEAISAAAAVVTRMGARTSHAAVVARQLGKVCLVGCDSLTIDPSGRSCRLGAATVKEGDWLSVDGSRGLIFAGALAFGERRPDDLLRKVASWRGVRQRG